MSQLGNRKIKHNLQISRKQVVAMNPLRERERENERGKGGREKMNKQPNNQPMVPIYFYMYNKHSQDKSVKRVAILMFIIKKTKKIISIFNMNVFCYCSVNT